MHMHDPATLLLLYGLPVACFVWLWIGSQRRSRPNDGKVMLQVSSRRRAGCCGGAVRRLLVPVFVVVALFIGAALFLSYAWLEVRIPAESVVARAPRPVVGVRPRTVRTDRHTPSHDQGHAVAAAESTTSAGPRQERRTLADWAGADHWPASVYCTVQRAGQALADQVAEYLIDNAPKEVGTLSVELSGSHRTQRSLRDWVPIAESLRRKGWREVTVHVVSTAMDEDSSEADRHEREDAAWLDIPPMPNLPLNGNSEDWERYGKAMERWGEQFDEHMDEWGQYLGKRYEEIGEKVAAEAKRRAGEVYERIIAKAREKAERIGKQEKPEKPEAPASPERPVEAKDDGAGAWIRLVHESRDADRADHGRLSAIIRLPGDESREAGIVVRYVNKPWVRQDRYRDSRGARFVIGRSGLEPTADQAMNAAYADAVGQVRGMLEDRLDERRPSRDERARAKARIYQWAARFVGQKLADDEFTQGLRGRHVDVHRSAVLVRADDESLADMLNDIVRGTRLAQKSWFQQIAGVVAVGVFLLLAYFFLNAGTKGHFAWKLRALCACTYALLCWAIFHFGLFS